jgi:hypothetical protein
MSDPKIDTERMKKWEANILPVPSAERLKGKGSSPSACSAWDSWGTQDLAKEIQARMTYFYTQTDGTMNFPNSAEGDLLKMVHTLLQNDWMPHWMTWKESDEGEFTRSSLDEAVMIGTHATLNENLLIAFRAGFRCAMSSQPRSERKNS